VGDHVDADEVIVIIETDKVSVDIRAPAAGKLKAQLAKEGDTIKVGDELAQIDTDDQGGGAAAGGQKKEQPDKKPEPSKQQTQPPEKKQQKPDSASSDAAHVHDAQSQHVPVAHAEEEVPLPSPHAEAGRTPQDRSTSQPGSRLVEKPVDAAAQPAATKPAAASSSSAKPSSPASSSAAPPAAPPAPPAPGSRSVRRVPMSRMRQTIAKRLKEAQNTAACLTTFNEVDMTALQELRGRYKDEFFERTGVKLGFMSAFVKASVAALLKFPDVNASIEGNELVYHEYVDVSVAVSTPTGLVVPVLRNCESLSFAQVEASIGALGAKARKGQIALEDMTGGTFTISNGGVYGSLFGTPILNPPQSGILGMHGIFKRPVAIQDKVEIRPMMYIALTYDHRVVDGSTAVQFLKEIKLNVEDPSRLLLNI
jgi:2-oxoglutarate dehydrogenase E2 component (dihydrolipoamide succinyltransferase)